MTERELGSILEGIAQLDRRLDRVDQKIEALRVDFNEHRPSCMREMSMIFVRRGEFGVVVSLLLAMLTAVIAMAFKVLV
jgi:tetrahydromethanopterin S-methyltransferase subunit G